MGHRNGGVRKGCLAIMVGSEGEEKKRFVVPVVYFNHPLFLQLLNEAEEEYGFHQKGAITLPCHVEDFINIHSLIDKDHHHNGGGSSYHGSEGRSSQNHHIHLHVVGCFKTGLIQS
ncbi:SAUR-like auxin-responsive protein family [Zostera marina]|uniref:SAUR-like auxin-responsive protein family n=1 Tax=Zostera marina TaxID=29655 RepID=A0A0K9PGR6_ZOSMR|nr:SAUR-like auxin-responsive protein family [Zostera marina]